MKEKSAVTIPDDGDTGETDVTGKTGKDSEAVGVIVNSTSNLKNTWVLQVNKAAMRAWLGLA